jgi:hypothetical protein
MPRNLNGEHDKRLTVLKRTRLALGGAALGVAVVGTISPALGISSHSSIDWIGAVAGGVIAAVFVQWYATNSNTNSGSGVSHEH